MSRAEEQFQQLFGFLPADLSSWKRFVQLLYRPMDPASLGIIRALFGLMMVLDIPEERGLAHIDMKWGDPNECHFPLFNFLHPLPLEWMCVVYLIMWCGAFGIMTGLYFRLSCLAFIIPYWYIFLLEKATWNNHTYLYGLVSLLLLGSGANHYWSLDCYLGRVKPDTHVPLWNYAILRFQFFLLYFYAGLKKFDQDWLGGYSMTNLNHHWIFEPFKLLLTPEQVDYWIIHFSGFLLDLTIGFWLFFDKTRPYAFFFCSSFHLMNSRIFSIGMFAYVCLVTLPLFSHVDWPRKLLAKILMKEVEYPVFVKNESCIYKPAISSMGKDNGQNNGTEKLKAKSDLNSESKLTWKHHLVVILLLSHVGVQAFLPYSHFITKGYNNWTNGLYGYSWDMMVHTWDTILVVIKVVDNNTGREHFLDPEAWVQTDRWNKHADMIVQYGQCLKRNLLRELNTNEEISKYITSPNISIYIDVWCSLNGRFQQRMYDPRVDVLQVEWSPFRKVSWLMPLLTEFSSWRENIIELEKEIYTWSNYSDALFVADFPGLTLENYINPDLTNVTLTVLEGEVIVEEEAVESKMDGQDKLINQTVGEGKSVRIPVGVFHKVRTSSPTPSCYMYTYINQSRQIMELRDPHYDSPKDHEKKEGVLDEIRNRIDNFFTAIAIVSNAVLNLLYSVPMVKRVRVG
ncbi:vitamin K-dependent gamma-carboxylase [Anabrus simplex]|uniref:vitamin K-dependent gamma-carboxylase n=1 Tax=Anabrus simplex TaxID=316456 RepID=UPI0035A2A266